MSIHRFKIESRDEYYAFWQGHKRALAIDYRKLDDILLTKENKEFKQWDTVMLENDLPKWKDLPIYRRISYIEDIKGGILLHLKE